MHLKTIILKFGNLGTLPLISSRDLQRHLRGLKRLIPPPLQCSVLKPHLKMSAQQMQHIK